VFSALPAFALEPQLFQRAGDGAEQDVAWNVLVRELKPRVTQGESKLSFQAELDGVAAFPREVELEALEPNTYGGYLARAKIETLQFGYGSCDWRRTVETYLYFDIGKNGIYGGNLRPRVRVLETPDWCHSEESERWIEYRSAALPLPAATRWSANFDLVEFKRENFEARDLPNTFRFGLEYQENLSELARTTVELVKRDENDDNVWEQVCLHRFQVSFGLLKVSTEYGSSLELPLVAEQTREEPASAGACAVLEPRAFLKEAGVVQLRFVENLSRLAFAPVARLTPKLAVLPLFRPIQIRLREEGNSFIPAESIKISELLGFNPAALTFSLGDHLHWTRPMRAPWMAIAR
jgi:hypothetical protein